MSLVAESRPLLEGVQRGFRHLRKGERIMACATLEEWCKTHCGVTADWLRKRLNPSEAKALISSSTGEVIETRIVAARAMEPSADKNPPSLVNPEIPVLRNANGEVLTPARFTPRDAINTALTFIESAMEGMTGEERTTVCRSLAMELEREWTWLKVGTQIVLDGVGFVLHSFTVSEQKSEQTSHVVTMRVASLGGVIHTRAANGFPVCKHNDARRFGESGKDYLYTKEGEAPSCERYAETEKEAAAAD